MEDRFILKLISACYLHINLFDYHNTTNTFDCELN